MIQINSRIENAKLKDKEMHRRGRFFCQEETDQMLQRLKIRLSPCKEEWDAASREHDEQYDQHGRAVNSLRREFPTLCSRKIVPPGSLLLSNNVLRAKHEERIISDLVDLRIGEEITVDEFPHGDDAISSIRPIALDARDLMASPLKKHYSVHVRNEIVTLMDVISNGIVPGLPSNFSHSDERSHRLLVPRSSDSLTSLCIKRR